MATLFSVFALTACTDGPGGGVKKVSSGDLNSLENKASYALGVDMAKNIKMSIQHFSTQFEDLDTNIVKAAFYEVLGGGNSLLDSAEINTVLQEFQQAQMDKKKHNDSIEAIANNELGQKFIADQLAANPKLVSTGSGLVYEVLKEGSGAKPTMEDNVKAIYKGTLIDGTMFDQSPDGQPIEFPLKNVIKGWQEGLQLMNVGAKYRFIIPAHIAYANLPAGEHIKPGSTLVFEVELVEIIKR